MKARQKNTMSATSYPKAAGRVRKVKGKVGGQGSDSRKLLVKAFSHPEGSSERLQVFSKYLNALHDDHAK
jgi:arginyl-tRNA--protein-N-Asp/Glu arginylyltransferase